MLTGQATKRLPKSKVTSSREPPAPARACAGQRRRDTRGGGTVGDQQGQEGASRRLRRRSRRTTAPKDGPGHPTLACDDGPSAMHSSRHSAPRKPSRGLTLQLSLTSSSSGPLSSSSSSSLRRWEQQRRFSPRVSEVAQKTAAKPQLEKILLRGVFLEKGWRLAEPTPNKGMVFTQHLCSGPERGGPTLQVLRPLRTSVPQNALFCEGK